ncbi:DUF4258 domain-containing protein [Pseudomonas sp. Marseille-Q5115]|uniref:DUF4258 domain-containing protein n=1 Tax=Pseudomonas sp. Marseille-Q5115 TaxID=2866593 RepID=UPI001CE4A485|nr:DUF4258 domain-containing protein [Pseudomonas sp. Marseille-Q5115]
MEDIVHVLAMDSWRVIITDHCQQRMEQRGVTYTEVLRCLQRGLILDEPSFDNEHNMFKFRMSEPQPRDIACVVVAVKPSPEPGELFAVTVWEV